MTIRSQNQLPHSPNVRYYEAPAFFGKNTIPRAQWPIALGLLAVAAIIGIILGFTIVNDYVYADRKHAAAVEQVLSTIETQPIPVLNDYRNHASGDLRNALAEQGYTLVDNPIEAPEGSTADELDIDKLPANFNQASLDAIAANGVESMQAETAAAYLADWWNLKLYRADATDLKVKYCIFGPATIEQAIVQAVETQGWQNSSLGESGVDQIGNTYQHGTVDIDGHQYRWSVYGCPLSDVYSIPGLPDTSWYISARLMG